MCLISGEHTAEAVRENEREGRIRRLLPAD